MLPTKGLWVSLEFISIFSDLVEVELLFLADEFLDIFYMCEFAPCKHALWICQVFGPLQFFTIAMIHFSTLDHNSSLCVWG